MMIITIKIMNKIKKSKFKMILINKIKINKILIKKIK